MCNYQVLFEKCKNCRQKTICRLMLIAMKARYGEGEGGEGRTKGREGEGRVREGRGGGGEGKGGYGPPMEIPVYAAGSIRHDTADFDNTTQRRDSSTDSILQRNTNKNEFQ
jgi:hypothetical protein